MTAPPTGTAFRVAEPDSRARWIVPAVASAVFGLAMVAVVILTAERYQGYTAWISAVGIIILIAGVIIGSESLIGTAIVPLLLAAFVSGPGGDDPGLGRAVLIGCAFYAIAELGWESTTDRVLGGRPSAIRHRRLEEVAMVLAPALLIGLIAVASSSLAPARTPLTRGAAVAAGIVVLVALRRRLRE